MSSIEWHKYPLIVDDDHARSWLRILCGLGRAPATVDAYARGLQAYFRFCSWLGVGPADASLEHVALYVRFMRGEGGGPPDLGTGLASTTVHQRLTAIRQWYAHLIYAGVRDKNPVPSGRYLISGRGARHDGFKYGLVRRVKKLPRVPTGHEWKALVAVAARFRLRDRLMFALAYHGALRRQELVELRVSDFDFAHRTVRLRTETTKSGQERLVHYAPGAGRALCEYLRYRHSLSRDSGALFLSESNRNRGEPITKWTWNDVAARLRREAGVQEFSPHTLRHARLTHLARAGWPLHELCAYAGHTSPKTTMVYIHLSGREVAARAAHTMAHVDASVERALFLSTSS